MFNDKLSIIVYSCWKNRDMWKVFSTLFKKYWKSCPYQVILLTDIYHETDIEYVFTKIVQVDDTWARMIKKAISEAKTPYVSLWMDDYLLCDYVEDDKIEIQLERAIKYNALNVRLIESPVSQGYWRGHKNIGYYRIGTAYALSTQIGIWDSSLLSQIIKNEWSAWDFERIASTEVQGGGIKQKMHPILVALDYEFPYEEGVRKGRWMQQGAKLCKRNGIKIDTNIRPVMSNLEMAKIYFLGAILDWNATLVVKIQNFLRKCIMRNKK